MSYLFIVLWSRDRKNFFLHSLMWIIQLGEQLVGKKGSKSPKTPEVEREQLLEAWHMRRSRHHYQTPLKFQIDEHPYSQPPD